MSRRLVTARQCARCLIVALAVLFSPVLLAQPALDGDSRLAVYDAATGVLHIPSLPYQGRHLWVDLLYHGGGQATAIASGPAGSDRTLASLDAETGTVFVPFVAFEGVEDDGRYALGLTILGTSPEVVLRVDAMRRHTLHFHEIPDHAVRLVAANGTDEHFGLTGRPGSGAPFGVVYAIGGTEGLTAVTLLLNDDGVPASLVHGEQVLPIDGYAAAPVIVADDDAVTLASAAAVLGVLSYELRQTAEGAMADALRQACDSFLLLSLGFFLDSALFEGSDTVVASISTCSVTGGGCATGFAAGLNEASTLVESAAKAAQEAAELEPEPGNRRPVFTTLDTLGPVFQDRALALDFTVLRSASNARDRDGRVSAFLVTSVSAGTLVIGGAPFDAATNNRIDGSHAAVWTAPGTAGVANAFTLVAVDDERARSLTPVQARITVDPLFGVGLGTIGSPWEIASAAELDRVRERLDGHFVLTADIDLGGDDPAGAFHNGGEGWLPLGTDTAPFTGGMTGGGHVISGLFIDRVDDSLGLFGTLDVGALVTGMTLLDVDVTGRVDTSFVNAGSLAGRNEGVVMDSQATGAIGGEVWSMGGLVGSNGGSILRSHATVSVDNESGGFVGGLAGDNHDGTISDSYARGTVQGATVGIGGLAGDNEGGEISNSYTTGEVLGQDAWLLGGLTGDSTDGTVTGSYWDTQTTGQSSSAGGTGLGTVQMLDQASYSGWDFIGVWGIDPAINEGYPHLRDAPPR